MNNKLEFRQQLLQNIAPFYTKLRDDLYGGFFGRVDYSLALYRKTSKNLVQNSRFLWFFSALSKAYPMFGYEEYAKHALSFLLAHGLSPKGGVYWSLSYAGEVEDDSMNTFCQAYAIIGLSEYYEAFHDPLALSVANNIRNYVEANLYDGWGYIETPENAEDIKTLPTLIHLLEAYSALYRVNKSEESRSCLEKVLSLVMAGEWGGNAPLGLAYTKEMKRIPPDYRSFGHEVETSYLVDQAFSLLGKPLPDSTLSLATGALEDGFSSGHLCYRDNDERAVHWVQCEGVLAFMHAYERCRDERFLIAAEEIWAYIREHLVDSRIGGEWFYDDSGLPKDIVTPWKGPYNNGRLCLLMGE